jgi:predicted ATPase/class 3 adenylate cyclase/uncharacterized protein HemY
MADLPSGTVTFLFTDIEGSTRLWEQHPQAMPNALARHDSILRHAIAAHGGVVYKVIGDAFQAAFETAASACAAACSAQHALLNEAWGKVGAVRVRMALHTCAAAPEAGDYRTGSLNRLGRLLGAAHGSQIVLSRTAADLARDSLPPDLALISLGERELRDLSPEPVFQLMAPDLPAEFPRLRTHDRRPHNLPSLPTHFVGREQELCELHRLLADPNVRLVTLVGPGGIGKTRLAMEVALRECENFDDGAYFVPLAALDDAELMASPIADALGFSLYVSNQCEKWERDRQRAQLVAYLRDEQLLLVLDNLEHLQGDLRLISTILAAASRVKILVTSRTRLDLQGETCFVLGGMTVPQYEPGAGALTSPTDEALRLFTHCARRVQPDFTLTSDTIGDVVAICRLVEGMPLAIELAAAWIVVLAPSEIVAEIQRNLDFLASNLRDIPERQRSIRSIFDASWDNLGNSERDIFAQMSVFQSGFTRQAIQQVTGASLQTLMALVRKSLVQPSSTGRYHIHELLRQFAAEQLAGVPSQEEAVRERHCAYYSAFLAAREADLNGPRQGQVLAEIEQEIYNVRDAWKWATTRGQLEYIAQAMESLCEFYRIRGHYEEGWVNFDPAALALGWPGFGSPSTDTDASAQFTEIRQLLDEARAGRSSKGSREEICGKVLARYGRLHCESPENDWRAIEVRSQALKRLSDAAARHEMAYILRYTAHIGLTPWQTRELYQSALGIFREYGDSRGIGETLYRLGLIAAQLGEYREAKQLYKDSLEIIGRLGRLEMKGNCLSDLGYIYWALGDYSKAEACCQEAQAVSATVGNRSGIAWSGMQLARVAMVGQDYGRAKHLIYESLRIYDESGLLGWKAEALGALSQVLWLEGNLDAAEATAVEALGLCRERDYHAGTLVPLMVLGQIGYERKDWQTAKQAIREVLQVARDVSMPAYTLHALVGVVKLLLSERRHGVARDIAVSVSQHDVCWQWTRACVASLVGDLADDGEVDASEEHLVFANGTPLDAVVDRVLQLIE